MLCVKLKSFDRACGPTTGGISRIWIFDREDFNFTQAAADVDGNKPTYSALARRTNGSGAVLAANVTTGAVDSVVVTNGGTGYTTAPIITFTGGGGSGAAATAVVSGGVITAINVTSGGTGYTGNPTAVITPVGGATAEGGAKMFPVSFENKEAEYKYSQSRKGSSVKYEHSLEFILPDLSQFVTQWNEKIDQASACCGIGLVVELNSGKILVLGEKWVNNTTIPNWEMKQDGASGTSGKLFDDMNAHTAVIKGDFNRGAYEFSGGVASILAMQ